MTTEEIIITVVRVLGSLPVLVFPFWGAIFAILVDLSDLFLKNLLDEGGVRDYQELDKWLDQVYMLTFLIVALRWEPVPRNIAVGLYAFRLLGFVVFEVTQDRELLILFPNLFEFWFVFVAGLKQFGLEASPGREGEPRLWGLLPFRYSAGQLAAVLAVLTGAKLAQEYVLHVGQWFENFTAVEAVDWMWETVTPPW
jgi:hypothetical protein